MLSRKSYTRITLSLDIIRKIPEGAFAGYHELGIIKHQIDLFDIISIEPAKLPQLFCNDPRVPLDSSNICMKAVDLVKKERGIDENLKISIEKNIPVMGGLAGGSTNAATTLLLLDELWDLKLSHSEIIRLGRQLGMDVPFYFIGNTAFDTEATGHLDPIRTNANFTFILALPEFGVSTKDAYSDIDYSRIGKNREKTAILKNALETNSIDQMSNLMHNDFELSVFKRYPELKAIRDALLDLGCSGAMMTGSGSTLFGVARDRAHAESIQQGLKCRSLIACTLQS